MGSLTLNFYWAIISKFYEDGKNGYKGNYKEMAIK